MAFLFNPGFPSTVSEKPGVSSSRDLIHRFRGWVALKLAPDEDRNNAKPCGLSFVVIAAVVFLLALAVGLLQWQDSYGELLRGDTPLQTMGYLYTDEANRGYYRVSRPGSIG